MVAPDAGSGNTCHARCQDPPPRYPPGRVTWKKGLIMPTWLIILIIGVVLLILGVAVEAAQFLIWLGIIVLVVSLILGLVGRGKARV